MLACLTGEPVPIVKGSHVYLIDGSGYIFRAFHALPPLTRPSDGLPVGAVHGFCAMLWKLLRESKASEAPTHLAVIFDASEKTFRNDIYDKYKAQRPPPPEELVPQFPLIRDAVKAFNVACLEQLGYEADDLIATYAKDIVANGGDVTIVSSDKDLMQLVRPGVVMFDGMKNKKIGRDEVIEKFGVPPDKVIDVQSLAGDFVDNVPGVPGIGVKTAAELINEYGDLDALLARAGEIKQPKRREKLIEFADQARISRDLVRLKDDVPVEVGIDALGVHDPDPQTLLGFLRVMEFNTLTKRIAEKLGTEPPAPLEKSVGSNLAQPAAAARKPPKGGELHGPGTPAAGAAIISARLAKIPCDRTKYETVTTLGRSRRVDRRRRARRAALPSTRRRRASTPCRPISSASRSRSRPARPATCRSATRAGSGDLFGDGGGLVPGQVPLREALALLKPLLEDAGVLKIGQNIKYDCPRARAPRHRHRPDRRHHAALLHARRRPRRPRHGRALRSATSATPASPFEHVHRPRARRQEDRQDLRRRADRQGDGVRRRGRRRHAPPLADAEAAARRRAPDDSLRTLERPLLPVIVDMEKAGIKVDRGDPRAPLEHVRAARRRGSRRRSTSSPVTSSISARRSSSASSCSTI